MGRKNRRRKKDEERVQGVMAAMGKPVASITNTAETEKTVDTESQPETTIAVQSEAKVVPEPIKLEQDAKLELQPEPNPKLVSEPESMEPKIVYLISNGPIRSQIYQAHADAFNQELKQPAYVVFSFQAFQYHSRTRRSPMSREDAILTIQVTAIGYDDSPINIRANHLVISGVIITPPDAKIELFKEYQDLTPYEPFQAGAKIRLFYRLDNRAGAILKVEYASDEQETATLKFGVPRDYNYITTKTPVCAT